MYSDGNDFNSILNRMLANVDDGLDKREGSIIYDALAPAAAELAQCYIQLDVYLEQTYLLTATGESLDKIVAESGITRLPATKAQVIISIYDNNNALMDVDMSSRFAAPNDYGGYNFSLISRQSEGVYVGECETAGTNGSSYIGDLLPLQSINNLGNATITSIVAEGEDTETDEELRKRTLSKLNQEAFAGNKAAYRNMAIEQPGVADGKVFPVWNGGGTVKLAVVGPNHTLLGDDAIAALQEKIDPVLDIIYVGTGSETTDFYFTHDGVNYQLHKELPLVNGNSWTFLEGDMIVFSLLTKKTYIRDQYGDYPDQEIATTSGTSGTQITLTPHPSGKGLGLAPIGHQVTVVSPTAEAITVSATIQLDDAVQFSQVETPAKEQVMEYIYEVQNNFVEKDVLTIYLAKVSAAILNVKGIKNITALTIKGSAADYEIDNSAGTTVKYPTIQASGVTIVEAT